MNRKEGKKRMLYGGCWAHHGLILSTSRPTLRKGTAEKRRSDRSGLVLSSCKTWSTLSIRTAEQQALGTDVAQGRLRSVQAGSICGEIFKWSWHLPKPCGELVQNRGETTTLTSLFSSRKSDSRPGLRHRSHCPLCKMGSGATYRSCLDAAATFVPTVCALGY